MLKFILPIILAGGNSNRMGFNKSFLKINGLYFLHHIIIFLYKIGFNKVYISNNSRNYGKIYNYFIDYSKYKGPLNGIYSVMNNCISKNYKNFLFIPVDMPFLTFYIILKLFNNIDNFSTIIFSFCNFPLLLNISNEIKVFLHKLFLYNFLHFISINFLIDNLCIKYIICNNFYKSYFINVNFFNDLKFLSLNK